MYASQVYCQKLEKLVDASRIALHTKRQELKSLQEELRFGLMTFPYEASEETVGSSRKYLKDLTDKADETEMQVANLEDRLGKIGFIKERVGVLEQHDVHVFLRYPNDSDAMAVLLDNSGYWEQFTFTNQLRKFFGKQMKLDPEPVRICIAPELGP